MRYFWIKNDCPPILTQWNVLSVSTVCPRSTNYFYENTISLLEEISHRLVAGTPGYELIWRDVCDAATTRRSSKTIVRRFSQCIFIYTSIITSIYIFTSISLYINREQDDSKTERATAHIHEYNHIKEHIRRANVKSTNANDALPPHRAKRQNSQLGNCSFIQEDFN